MPRKISLDEALKQAQALATKAGLKIAVTLDERFDQKERELFEPQPKVNKFVDDGRRKTVKLALYARHSVGCGGNMALREGQETVSNNGYLSFGPGICDVPRELAADLEYRDREARAADERFLDRTERSFIIGAVRTASGGTFYRGFEVSKDGFDMTLGGMNPNYRGI